MKYIVKSLILFVLTFAMISGVAAFAADAPTVNVWEESCRIIIAGSVGAEKAGQHATIMLIKKSADPENVTIADVGFVDQIKIDDGGSYKFSTGYDGSISDYNLFMHLAGENITDTLETAITTDNLIKAEVDVVCGKASADITVGFTNEMFAEGQEYTVIAAYYDANQKLITAQTVHESVVSAGTINQAVNVDSQYVENAAKLKVFVWDLNERAIPLADSFEAELSDLNAVDDNELNIVFIGDSIYEGAGATETSKNWVSQVGEWFNTTFEDEDTTVNYYNKGVSGTSTHYSLMRFERDVLSYNPDIVFIGSSTNDGAGDTRREIESMVRTLNSQENPPYIIITHLARYDKVSAFASYGARGKAVADHYGIPFYDATNDMKSEISSKGATTDEYYSDNVHPSDKGYKVIADSIIKGLSNRKLIKKAKATNARLVENSVILNSAESFSSQSSRVTTKGTWKTGSTSKGEYVQATAVGDTLKFTFTGNAIGFEYAMHKNSGTVEIYVDGEHVATCNPRYNDTITSYQTVCRDDSVYFDIGEDKEHTVVLKAAESQGNVAESDYLVRIHSIFTASVTR